MSIVDDTHDWRVRAACTIDNAPLFDYDPKRNGRNKAAIADAKAICHSCPVLDSCVLDILDHEAGTPLSERYEIVGALTPEERVKLDPTVKKRRTNKPKPPVKQATVTSEETKERVREQRATARRRAVLEREVSAAYKAARKASA